MTAINSPGLVCGFFSLVIKREALESVWPGGVEAFVKAFGATVTDTLVVCEGVTDATFRPLRQWRCEELGLKGDVDFWAIKPGETCLWGVPPQHPDWLRFTPADDTSKFHIERVSTKGTDVADE